MSLLPPILIVAIRRRVILTRRFLIAIEVCNDKTNNHSILPHAGNNMKLFRCYEAKIEENEKAGSHWEIVRVGGCPAVVSQCMAEHRWLKPDVSWV